ncbi:phosphotransferase enzyme family protein [Paenibacillus koleovorans]|uniref:phosphotransferase enzyme family protein n=1 Tax=Paenibacillus koleovorans TaxID=121608 RepID=UPI000FD8F9A2|nr:phosphotransferase [Paenibacillus koleovorans]
MDEVQLLKTAIKQYGLNPSSLIVDKVIQSNNWHGDLHFKILVDNKYFSARFIGEKRYESDIFIKLSDEVLTEQIRFCNYLLNSGIPFMKHMSTIHGESFSTICLEDKDWKFVLFEWIKGDHLTHCTETIARTFGAFARKIHNISSKFDTSVFPQESHSKGHHEFYNLLCTHASSSRISPLTTDLLKSYLNKIEYHKDRAKSTSHDFIIQSDLNPLNILWNQSEQIIGVVDFESITYTDRVEGLAWLVKWYSRTHGIGSHEMSPILAKSVLQGYGADEILIPRDFERLPSLLWLTGCLNWNFTAKTIELIKNKDDALLKEHLIKYLKRLNPKISS